MNKFDLPEDLDDVEVIELDEDDISDDDYGPADALEPEADGGALPPPVDLAARTFALHKQSVFACALSADGRLALTGGEDDAAHLWATATGAPLLACTGHRDSVTAVAFNSDASLAATGDMGGLVQVWSVAELKLVWCFEGDDLEWLAWHGQANVLLAGTREGDVFVWQVPSGQCKTLASPGPPCTCGRLLPDGRHLLAGYGDGRVRLWDIKPAKCLWTHEGGDAPVISLEVSADGALVSVAPTSALLKAQDGKLLGTLLVEGGADIEAHAFHHELNVLVTGSLAGQLCVWDVGRRTVRHMARIECPVTVVRVGGGERVYVGATDGAVYVCDVRSGTLIETLTGHHTDILSLCVAVNGDGDLVLTGSDDGTAKIFTK